MSDQVGDRVGRRWPFTGKNVVKVTTLVDLARQLSNLQEVVLHLAQELSRLG